MTFNESLEEQDKKHIAKQILNVLQGITVRPPIGFADPMVYIKHEIDQDLPSKLPVLGKHHFSQLNDIFDRLEYSLKTKIADPKNIWIEPIRKWLKKTNVFIKVDFRVEEGLYALNRCNYIPAQNFELAYKRIYKRADQLQATAKQLPKIKYQSTYEREADDRMLVEYALELIEEMRILCDDFLSQLTVDFN